MTLYMTHFAYTADAWAKLSKNPEDRRIPLRGLLEKLGGRLVELYYGFGEYDGFLIYEAPDEVTATATVLAAIAPGHVKAIQTTTLLTVEQAMAAMRKAGAQMYPGPKG
jgi:uncharacterized protein with GYD domain